MVHDVVARAQRRAEQWIFALPVLEAVLARRDAARELDGDAALRAELGHELCRHREPDGSWAGSISRTAESLLLLAELFEPADRAARVLAGDSVSWLLRRQRGPLRPFPYCDPWLHERGICVHEESGFFAAPAGADLRSLTLQHGAGFLNDTDARIAISSLALAAVVTWSAAADDAIVRHYERLAHIIEHERPERHAGLSTNTLACGCRALLAGDAAMTGAALALVTTELTKLQRADGSWPDGDLFFVLDVLTRVAAVATHAPRVAPALQRAARTLALQQKPDGNWGRGADAWHMLVGWRVLRAASDTTLLNH